jgi:hypothetical protein
MSPDKETSTHEAVASQAAMHSAKDLTGLLVRSPPWWSMPHSMRNEAPDARVYVVASSDGQETAVALAEALELTLVDDSETVDEAEDEVLEADAELLADELDDTSSLAPQT